MMNPAAFALRKRTIMVVLTLVLIGAGIVAYLSLGRLEDPSFTIKTAMVVTQYPGASPLEVEQEVTDVIEEAVQAMGQIKEISSTSAAGVSYITVDIKDTFKSDELPQIWDELRRKVNDAQVELPPGAGPSIVNDDFGDVYGVFFALTGEGYSFAELEDYADSLKTELLRCKDVARIDLWGVQRQVVYVEIERSRLATFGISPSQIYATLSTQNAVTSGGRAKVDGEWLRLSPTGDMTDPTEIANLLIGGSQGMVRLGDLATIHTGYQDPPKNLMLFNGKPAIGFGVATVDGGNVVTMGQEIKKSLAELEPNRPVGMGLHSIYYQSDIVTESVNTFMVNLAEAVAIVVVLLMLFMGWQSGLLIGGVLVLTILATLLGMLVLGVDLQKISLGSLILALGMLVDNAIVVADGILVRVQRGQDREEAARNVVQATQWPLLGATAVAVLAFAAIGFAPGNVGEFCRSLFTVMALSLFLSWILAVTVTPLFCVWFLKTPKAGGPDPHDSPVYRLYRRFLHWTIRLRWLALPLGGAAMAAALAGFALIPQGFFPDSTQRRFYVNYWKPQGTQIEKVIADLKTIEAEVRTLDGVENVTTVVGENALRFMLTYDIAIPNRSYGQLLVEVEDFHQIPRLIGEVEDYLQANYPDAEPYCVRVPTGPSVNMKVEAEFRGPDIKVLERLSAEALKIFRAEPLARDVRTNWRQKVRVIRPHYSESQARRVGVSREDLANALQWNFSGLTVGLFRKGDKLMPIVSRPPEAERRGIGGIGDVQVFSSTTGKAVPINQVATGVEAVWEYPLIQRKDRQRVMTVQANQVSGLPEALRQKLIPTVEGMDLPLGYTMEWVGEYDESQTAQAGINKIFPYCLLGMFLIVVWLFNSIRRPLVIFMTLPLAIIGVTAALILTQLPFGFMSILGFLGLSGMLIKNAIVLIDEIDVGRAEGKPDYDAVIDSGVSRARPVIMAAGTTILGMAPLVTDPLYASMAATIMGGLFVATFLTLFFVPILYTLVYRIKPRFQAAGAKPEPSEDGEPRAPEQ